MSPNVVPIEELDESSDDQEVFICVTCQAEYEKPHGKCPSCNAWGSIQRASDLEEEDEEGEEDGDEEDLGEIPEALPINKVPTERTTRIPTGIGELDRVLGGGVVLGGATLVGGDPGVGKSTLLLQALGQLSGQDIRGLYATGEENASQVALRGERVDGVNPNHLFLIADQRAEVILRSLEEIQPQVLVLDSIQTVHLRGGPAGTITQMRDVANEIIQYTKQHHIATFFIGHVTKDGTLAGPKVLEHLVDTVLAFEGEKGQAFRTLRAQKNRFGNALETGIFEMTETGMQEVKNASEFFLAERNIGAAGSIIAATCEASRSMLVEVQALVGLVKAAGSHVTATGVDSGRLSMILAVLDKALVSYKKTLAGRDIYVNLAGGLSVSEPALDLPIALAIASSLLQTPISPGLLAFGEIGLTSEIRGVPRADVRISEATSMGFQQALVPKSIAKKKKKDSKKPMLDVHPVRTLDEALRAVLPRSREARDKKR